MPLIIRSPTHDDEVGRSESVEVGGGHYWLVEQCGGNRNNTAGRASSGTQKHSTERILQRTDFASLATRSPFRATSRPRRGEQKP